MTTNPPDPQSRGFGAEGATDPRDSAGVGLPVLHQGKVRTIYDAGHRQLLMVASDRMSAFDVVMAEPIPDKGRILTAMSAWWFAEMGDIAPSHLISTDLDDFPEGAQRPELIGRTMLCHRADMLPIECIVRGYLSGSGWKEYQATGAVSGVRLPEGLRESERLPTPIFTPSTKAEVGDHDQNISFDQAVALVGGERAEEARAMSLALYQRAVELAAERGIIIADTKFELGLIDGQLTVADEMLTPDSSRFWPADSWTPGAIPPSFDKQPLRDWLETLDWDKTPPPPPLPDDVVEATRARYVEAYERITGLSFAAWPGVSAP